MKMGAKCCKPCCTCGSSRRSKHLGGMKWIQNLENIQLTTKEIIIVRDVWSVAQSSGQLNHMMARNFAENVDSKINLMAHFELSIPPGTTYFSKYVDIVCTDGLRDWAKHFTPDADKVMIVHRNAVKDTDKVSSFKKYSIKNQEDRRKSFLEMGNRQRAKEDREKKGKLGRKKRFSDSAVLNAADRLAKLGVEPDKGVKKITRAKSRFEANQEEKRITRNQSLVMKLQATIKTSSSMVDEPMPECVTTIPGRRHTQQMDLIKSAAYLKSLKAEFDRMDFSDSNLVAKDLSTRLAPAFMEHLLMILDAMTYLIMTLLDHRDFDECIEEMKKVHHPLEFVEKKHFQQFFDILDVALLETLGVKLYRKKARKSMQRFFNIVYISLIYGDEHYNQPYERQ